jgi:hypothetical protein
MPYDSARQRRFMHARHPGIASRWDEEERKRKSGVGKRMSGGSFESGPSAVVRGGTRRRVRRNTLSFSGHGGHGRRYGAEPGVERYSKAFVPTSVLSRTGKLGQLVDQGAQTLGAGMQAGRTGAAAASPTNKPGKVLMATGQKVGQATATPARAATTGATIGAAGTAATMGVTRPQQDPTRLSKAAGVMQVAVHGNRPRRYDPEEHRQRRLGAAQGIANTAGAAGLAAGAREYRDINRTRRATREGARIVNSRVARRVGGGLAALAAGEKIRRHANDPRNRGWK